MIVTVYVVSAVRADGSEKASLLVVNWPKVEIGERDDGAFGVSVIGTRVWRKEIGAYSEGKSR